MANKAKTKTEKLLKDAIDRNDITINIVAENDQKSFKSKTDGKTYECVGLGYRMFKYERKAITAKEFGPIFIKERQSFDGAENN